jgi:hypothetical protein
MGARRQSRRKTPPLAYSEYVSPYPNNSSQVCLARLELIEAVKRVFPMFLKTLSAEVFPLYRKLAKKGYGFDQILWWPAVSPYKDLTEAGGLKLALSEWAVKFHADSDWLKDEALRTLRGWYFAPEWRRSLRWSPICGSSSSVATGETFEFSYMGWETELLTWSRYSQLLHEELNKKLTEYEEDTRKLAESRGLVLAQRKYSPDNFDWFVLYQFAARSSTEIAKEKYKGKSTEDADSAVLKGIKAAAELIGWNRLRLTVLSKSQFCSCQTGRERRRMSYALRHYVVLLG